jgi:hypothetical protein
MKMILSTKIKGLIVLFFLSCLLFSCGDKKEILPPTDTLASYIEENASLPLIRDSLIACAAGGQEDFMVNDERPISIFYYPEGNAANFLYFETETIAVNPDDLSQYRKKDLPDAPILNGYLRHFSRAAITENIWCRVSFIKDGQLHISNAIRLKYNDLPTEFNPELLAINQAETLSPIFNWQDGRIAENAIYFQVISDADNNLLSGTYTYEKTFQFYNLDNVVLNIRDITPPPTLAAEEDYTFLMMTVSTDNWVNLIIEKGFDTR